MQTLKDDIREQILQIARKHFMQKGFLKTSMREIACEAGISVGSIYNYFDHKDRLFCCVVGPAVSELERLLQAHHGDGRTDLSEMFSDNYQNKAADEHRTLINSHRELLTILLFKAQGSSLECFRKRFTDRSTAVVRRWFENMKSQHPDINADIPEFTIRLHMAWEFVFIEEILRKEMEQEELQHIISEYVRFELRGWHSMINI